MLLGIVKENGLVLRLDGYHQVQMAEDSKCKTAFTCHLGLFHYHCMPFGLTNAPATFQCLMYKLFCGDKWNFVFIYLDDIIVISATMKEHIVHVKEVLSHLGRGWIETETEQV